jgi:hypothetical protein
MIYNPTAATGERFLTEGIPEQDIPRMYHSTATLLPDGSIMLGMSPSYFSKAMALLTYYPAQLGQIPMMVRCRLQTRCLIPLSTGAVFSVFLVCGWPLN